MNSSILLTPKFKAKSDVKLKIFQSFTSDLPQKTGVNKTLLLKNINLKYFQKVKNNFLKIRNNFQNIL